jgi:hypothetical protein
MASTGSARFLLREACDGERAVVLDLLEAAGWSRPLLAEWATNGTVLELYDPADDEPHGAAIVDAVDGATYELRAWASTVDPAEPTVSGRLVTAIADALRRSGGRRVVASVGDADPQRLTLLLAAGFRFASVVRDASSASAGRPGDRSRDLVWLDQDL